MDLRGRLHRLQIWLHDEMAAVILGIVIGYVMGLLVAR
jgi:hypothetical protein